MRTPNPLANFGPNAPLTHQLRQSGAKAILAVLTNYFDSPYLRGSTTNGRDKTVYPVPALWLSPLAGARIDEALARGRTRARLGVSARLHDGVTRNVVGELPGPGDDWVGFGTHHDAAWASAVQDTASVAAVLAQARIWSQVAPERRPHNMLFVLCAGHLEGSIGSLRLVRNNPAQLDRMVLHTHIEHIGTDFQIGEDRQLVDQGLPHPRNLYTPAIASVQEAAMAQVVSENLVRTAIQGPPPRGDSWPISVFDVPTIQLAGVPVYLMDKADTLDKVHQPSLVPITRALAEVTADTKGLSAEAARMESSKRRDDTGLRRRFDRNGDGTLDREERLALVDFMETRTSRN